MAQTMSMVVYKRHNDWDVQGPQVESAYNNCASAATGLIPSEVHLGRLPRMPITVFEHPNGHQSLNQD